MNTSYDIHLIRHGQASFGQKDYDQLSALGITQANLLAQQADKLAPIGQIYCGQLKRQQHTMTHFLQTCQLAEPSTQIHLGFNEFNHSDVLDQFDPQWRQWLKPDTKAQQLEQLLNHALKRWLSNDHCHDYQQSWQQFKQSCIDSLDSVIAQNHKGTNLLIFTSAGVITVLLQRLQGFDDRLLFANAAKLANSSITTINYHQGKLAISQINNHNHLPAELVSHK